ncbi:MAG: amidohydrolase family protein, partial [Gemmatimonadales bacterium]
AGGGHLITLGTDHPSWGEFFSGFSIHRELLSFARAGIPPADVIKFATTNAARALGVGDKLGTIETGKLADLVVVRGSPLTDIRNARNVRWVMKAGRIYDPDRLLASVEGTIGPRNADEELDWMPRGRAASRQRDH